MVSGDGSHGNGPHDLVDGPSPREGVGEVADDQMQEHVPREADQHSGIEAKGRAAESGRHTRTARVGPKSDSGLPSMSLRTQFAPQIWRRRSDASNSAASAAVRVSFSSNWVGRWSGVRVRKVKTPEISAISEFPKGRKYLISLSFRGKASVRPAQVGGFDVNIVIHGSTAVRGRGDLVAYRWALWKLTAPWTHRTRPPHLGKRCAFSTSSTGPFPSNHSRKTPKGPKIALGNPDRPEISGWPSGVRIGIPPPADWAMTGWGASVSTIASVQNAATHFFSICSLQWIPVTTPQLLRAIARPRGDPTSRPFAVYLPPTRRLRTASQAIDGARVSVQTAVPV